MISPAAILLITDSCSFTILRSCSCTRGELGSAVSAMTLTQRVEDESERVRVQERLDGLSSTGENERVVQCQQAFGVLHSIWTRTLCSQGEGIALIIRSAGFEVCYSLPHNWTATQSHNDSNKIVKIGRATPSGR